LVEKKSFAHYFHNIDLALSSKEALILNDLAD
jgi:hypothetical protein